MWADRIARALAAAALAALAVLPFAGGLRHAFVYDDHGVIVENAYLDATNTCAVLTLQTLGDPAIVDGQRPAVIATYLVDLALWGRSPAGFRLTNWLLHMVNTLLVWRLLGRFGGDRTGRWAAVLLFAWHPLMVEVVQVPSYREDSLLLAAGLIALLLGTRARAGIAAGIGAIAAYAAALLAKESAPAMAALLWAAWWWFPGCRPARRWMAAWSVAALAITAWFYIALSDGRALQATGRVWNGLAFRGDEAWWSAPWLAARWAAKLAWPFPLSADMLVDPVRSPLEPRWWVGCVFVAVTAWLIWWWRRSQPARAFALAWLAITFVPISNLAPLLNPMADRYACTMLPGFALLMGSLASAAGPRGIGALATAALLAAGGSALRIPDWRDDETLWRATLAVEPRSARAHTWLGLIAKEQGRRDEARTLFSAARALNPHDVNAAINLAVLHGEQGEYAEAEHLLREVLAVRPDHVVARQNLVLCLELQGKRDGDGNGDGDGEINTRAQ